MKKLPKLDLHGTQIMNDQQLKNILGGDNPNPSSGYPKIDACSGKGEGETCSWEYEGRTYYGTCKITGYPYVVHCSDLN